MSKAWIEDLWLTEPRETLPDGSKVKIPVPSSVTKSLAAYMKTVLLQCLFDRFGSVFPQCGLMVFPGVVIVSR